MSTPELRLAICRRCRQPERRAAGADEADALLESARRWAESSGQAVHVRLSQCLNCCDFGHTVRVEFRGREIALVGIRTVDHLHRLLERLQQVASGEVPAELRLLVHQIWMDGVLIAHGSGAREMLE